MVEKTGGKATKNERHTFTGDVKKSIL